MQEVYTTTSDYVCCCVTLCYSLWYRYYMCCGYVCTLDGVVTCNHQYYH